MFQAQSIRLIPPYWTKISICRFIFEETPQKYASPEIVFRRNWARQLRNLQGPLKMKKCQQGLSQAKAGGLLDITIQTF